MKWEVVNQYYAKNGNWTMTIDGKKELGNQKFCLFENAIFRAVCNTQKEAVAKHQQLIKEEK
jgi:hypothetical protein